ncbi:hypothetical protein H0H92_013838 [Tricholoma furcatifolium]|nr:hypothetical protein H0H92_013838 [Tricholoma furcatifolium]
MRTLYRTLSSTSSGSFLISKQPLTSSTPIIPPIVNGPPSIPLPDWSLLSSSTPSSRSELQKENDQLRESLHLARAHHHAQNMIVESSNAQLVIQNLHLVKLNGALNKKESRKKNERALLFDGKAKVLTSDEFQAGLQALADKREAAEAQKAKNIESRALRKEALVRVEEEWRRIKEAHEAELQKWDEECQRLATEGVPKKEWPKKPVRARKPQLSTSGQEQEDGGNEPNDEDDGDDDEV